MPLDIFLPFFKWCDRTMVGEWLRAGTWQFPLVETIHILALALLLANVVVLDLRLMGVLMRGWTVAGLTRELKPYLNWSLAVILTTGTMLYLSEAVKAFTNAAFWFKVDCLFLALLFHFTVVRKVTKHDEVSRATGLAVGGISLVLWFCIGLAGRAIAFV